MYREGEWGWGSWIERAGVSKGERKTEARTRDEREDGEQNELPSECVGKGDW